MGSNPVGNGLLFAAAVYVLDTPFRYYRELKQNKYNTRIKKELDKLKGPLKNVSEMDSSTVSNSAQSNSCEID